MYIKNIVPENLTTSSYVDMIKDEIKYGRIDSYKDENYRPPWSK